MASSSPNWDPTKYLQFADERLRPGLELVGRVPDIQPTSIVDLGCGTGQLTQFIAERWPDAAVVGIDSSPQMLEQARRLDSQIRWLEADIASWSPDGPVDLLFSNAALHWLDDHESLFPRLRGMVSPGGALAIQMPDNWDAPTHRIPATLLDGGGYPSEAVTALMRDRLQTAGAYRDWLAPGRIDMWRTTYIQELEGDDAVWDWVSGSLLRPVIDALDAEDLRRFHDACSRGYAEAYPALEGLTLVPFSRLFMVALIPV